MTMELLLPDSDLVLGVDGYQIVNDLDYSDGCCSDPLCVDEVASACAWSDLLPTGPMWDRQRAIVKDELEQAGGVPVGGFSCTSMATYAVYLSQVMADTVANIIAPPVRESSPRTAVTTVDDWLDRYQWVDCYRSACRSQYEAKFSPYEQAIECPEGSFVDCPFPDDYEAALKHAILMSLRRLSRGVIKNIDGINWVIAPLSARLQPPAAYPTEVQDYLDGNCDCDPEQGDVCPPCWCGVVQLELVNNSDTLPAAPTVDSFCDNNQDTVDAFQDCIQDAANVTINPSVAAADCIVRSLLPNVCPNIVTRVAFPINP